MKHRINILPPLLILITLAFCQKSTCSTVTSADLQKTLNEATLVAQIDVISLAGHSDPVQYASFESQATVLAIESTNDDGGWLPQPGDSISIIGPGGEWNNVGVMISGYPRPYAGKKYLAHLKRVSGKIFTTVGGDDGLVDLYPTHDYTRNRTDGINGQGTGPFLFWDPTYFPIPYFISETTFAGHPDYVAAIDESFRTWRNVQDIIVEFLPLGCTSKSLSQNDGVNSVLYITQNWQFDPSFIAITRNYYIAGTGGRAGMILDSDIMLNAQNHSFTTTNEPGSFDVQDIVTHEAGHFLGLGHDTVPPIDPDATMFAAAAPNETIKRTLHADDLAGIHAGYGGVGKKITPLPIPSCTFADQKYGCSAVHSTSRGLSSLWYALVYVALLLTLGRIVMWRMSLTSNASSPP